MQHGIAAADDAVGAGCASAVAMQAKQTMRVQQVSAPRPGTEPRRRVFATGDGATAVVRMALSESAGAPLDSPDSRIVELQWPDPSMFVMGLMEGHA